MVKKAVTILLLTGIFTVASLGFLAVSHMMGNGMNHAGCVAALAEQAFCPGSGNTASLNFHFNFLKSLAMAIFIVALVCAALVLLGFIGLKVLKSPLFFTRSLPFNFSENNFEQATLFWLSLHVDSPALAGARA